MHVILTVGSSHTLMLGPTATTTIYVHIYSYSLLKQMKNSELYIIIHNDTVTVNLFEILEILPGICLTTNRINYFPLILLWPIQIHHYF